MNVGNRAPAAKSPVLATKQQAGRGPPGGGGSPSLRHWSQRVQECVLSGSPDGQLDILLRGGADNGQFCWIADVKHDKIFYHTPAKLQTDGILLEVQGWKIAGYTFRDAHTLLKHVSKNGAPVMFKTVKDGEFIHSFQSHVSLCCKGA